MKMHRESGAIAVEASIYFPITIGIVMALIYLGLFKIQESYFFFQVERVASMVAKEAAYPGYEEFQKDGLLESSAIDFSWEDGPEHPWLYTAKRQNHHFSLTG